MDYNHICIFCMREKKENESICIGCGADERRYKYSDKALSPKTILRGRFLVGAVINAGPSGLCYSALDLITERRIDMLEWKSIGGGTAEQFIREEGLQAKKKNLPGIGQVYDTFTESGKLYAAVEHLPDDLLRDLLPVTSGGFSWKETVQLLLPVMETVGYLNEQGCVYGDIRPETVRIKRGGGKKISAKLAPFTGFEEGSPSGSVGSRRGPQKDVSGMAACFTKCLLGLSFSKEPSKKSVRKAAGLRRGVPQGAAALQ